MSQTDEPVAAVEENDGTTHAETAPAEPPPLPGDATTDLPRLVVKRAGAETEEVFFFSPPATVGRFDPAVGPVDVDLAAIPEGSYVSRKHAKITHDDEGYKLADLGSSNGTYVLRDGDFQKIDETVVTDGDEIALGNARFVFRTAPG
ncbi:MAG: FHA domain-containing protein [Fimbriimonadaceae bacterium]|nr:FHA domain-containing protein [Fimbriimonadaceae bacterium]